MQSNYCDCGCYLCLGICVEAAKLGPASRRMGASSMGHALGIAVSFLGRIGSTEKARF